MKSKIYFTLNRFFNFRLQKLLPILLVINNQKRVKMVIFLQNKIINYTFPCFSHAVRAFFYISFFFKFRNVLQSRSYKLKLNTEKYSQKTYPTLNKIIFYISNENYTIRIFTNLIRLNSCSKVFFKISGDF